MAVTTTTLDFKIPDGNELVNGGDNLIAHNAQTAHNAITADRVRLGTVETLTAGQSARLASVESAAFVGGGLLMEDPTDPGFFLVGGAA